MGQTSDCSKAQKKKVEQSYREMAVKFAASGGKLVANAAIGAYNAALDGIKALLNTEKTVLTPLAALDDLFIDGFIRFPFNTISGTIESTLNVFVVPLHTIGMLGGKCSDTRKAAESITNTMDGWRKDLDDTKRKLDKLDLISGKTILREIDNSIDHIDQWKITPIP